MTRPKFTGVHRLTHRDRAHCGAAGHRGPRTLGARPPALPFATHPGAREAGSPTDQRGPADVTSAPGPTPSGPSTVPPIRTQVRDAVARAWRRAVEAGELPAVADGLPAVEIERPAKPEH